MRDGGREGRTAAAGAEVASRGALPLVARVALRRLTCGNVGVKGNQNQAKKYAILCKSHSLPPPGAKNRSVTISRKKNSNFR